MKIMMKSGFAIIAALSLVACSGTQEASAPTRQLSDKERFVAAIEANGCVINIATIGPIMSQASINQDQLATLTVALETDGVLAPDGTDTVRLSSNNCI
ncbi:MAG: hypothetical protein ABJO29_06520 [Yoonia sp.]|uniref:hypothetical protein n=1 Tax=Yoonia sp. TaxID=2212373 RepID=UPI002206C069|nr:hypothetical protein K3729_12975 [Rhodobacteraceae bacterium S2214]